LRDRELVWAGLQCLHARVYPPLLSARFARLHPPPSLCTEAGQSRWGAKSNIPKPSTISRAKRVALKNLMTLADPNPAPKRGQPNTGLITGAAANGLKVHEGQILRTRGYLRLVATESNDCEDHIQLTLAASPKRSLIVEVAKEKEDPTYWKLQTTAP
jgi:hypothetical protein